MMSSKVVLPVAIVALLLVLLPQSGEAQSWGGFGPPVGGFQNFPQFPRGPPVGSYQNFPQFPTGPPNITCDQLNCAKGTCNISSSTSRDGSSYSFNYSYSCQCEPGWTWPPFSFGAFQAFVPCVLPNCTATNCNATEPAPPKQFDPTIAPKLGDPCAWAFCGEGDCVGKSNYTYECKCKPGFKNLFSDPVFPCYSDCSIGDQCKKQGVGFLPATAGPPGTGSGSSGDGGSAGGGGSSGGGKGGSAANTAIPDSFLGFLIVALSLAVVVA